MDRITASQFLNGCDPVCEAALYAGFLVADEKKNKGLGSLDAAQSVARRAKLPPSLLRGLIHASRRPKRIDWLWFNRIQAAYLDYLQRRLVELQAEIVRVKAMGVADGAVPHLLDDAKALVRDIEALL